MGVPAVFVVVAEESARNEDVVLVDLDKSNNWLFPEDVDAASTLLVSSSSSSLLAARDISSSSSSAKFSAVSLLEVMAPWETVEEAEAAANASMAAAMSGEDVTTEAALLQPAANWLNGPGREAAAEGPIMSLTVGKDAKEDDEAEATDGSMVVSMDGSRLRVESNDELVEVADDEDVEDASFEEEESLALESTVDTSAFEEDA